VSLKKVEAILLAKIGLQADSLGKDAVIDAARRRMSERGVRDPDAYVQLLSSAPEELQALIEAVVVSETWFFREPASYALLRERLAVKPVTGPVQVLCIPCATGEEPYSVVMTLMESGYPPERIEVHGVDVSRNALRVAAAGRYRRNSFRGQMGGHGKHFEEHDGVFQLSATVRRAVHFHPGNVLDPKLFAGLKFHAVFCRNLLIYLDRPSRAQALENLQRMLRPEGVLFVGHSEAGDVASHGLVRTGDPRSFAFVPGTGKLAPRSSPTDPTVLNVSVSAAAVGARAAKAERSSTRNSSQTVRGLARKAPSVRPRSLRPGSLRPGHPHRQGSPPGADLLAQARLLADSGALHEAIATCERALLYCPRDADLYSLLGIVQRAIGDMRSARASFMKAVEFDGGHHEALFHLGLLCESEGDLTGARYYRGRAQASRSGA
jgi:chemotaxis protein methyltransferase WspC